MFLAGGCKGAGRSDFEESVEMHVQGTLPWLAAAQRYLQMKGRRCGGRDCKASEKADFRWVLVRTGHGYQVLVVDLTRGP